MSGLLDRPSGRFSLGEDYVLNGLRLDVVRERHPDETLAFR